MSSDLESKLSTLPPEVLIEIILYFASKDQGSACAVARASSWANKLVEEILYFTVCPSRLEELWTFYSALHILRKDSTPWSALPIIDYFRLSFADIPGLCPSQFSRDRARLVHNLWTFPLDGRDHGGVEHHIYGRLAHQLCWNVRSLAMSGASFSHFLANKPEHFFHSLDTDVDSGEEPSERCILPHLRELTLLYPYPASVMQAQYVKASKCAQIFRQITHFTIWDYMHCSLPFSVDHFTSLTHIALPLTISNEIMRDGRPPSISEVFKTTLGWRLLESMEQLQMVVFLFPKNGKLKIDGQSTYADLCCSVTELILDANRLHNKAYALPIAFLDDLQDYWKSAARGGPSIWDVAKSTYQKYSQS